MSLHIDDPEAEALALELAKRTGVPVSQAVVAALRAQLTQAAGTIALDYYDVLAIARQCSSLPDLDSRPSDEILGYNALGVWD
jgi:antitoxin VapB